MKFLINMLAGSMNQALSLDSLTALAVRKDGPDSNSYSVIVKAPNGAQGTLPGSWPSERQANEYVDFVLGKLLKCPDGRMICARKLLAGYEKQIGKEKPFKKKK